MAEKFFPFTSLDDDRLYGSVDFRSFFRTILGDGRCSYDEIGIVDPTQSMLCTKDTLDNTKIEVSPGACYLFGAIFQTTDPLSLTVELPTGSTQNQGCVVARISDDIDRRINIITVEPESAIDEETDLILADYISSASGVVSVTDRMIVAFAKYHLSKSQQDYIIAQLGVNQDLVNYLSQNSQLITLISQNPQLLNLLGSSTTLIDLLANNTDLHVGLANNQDFIDLIKGTKAENYTFFVNSVDDILKIHRFDAGNDFSNILIRAGTYEIDNSMMSFDYLINTVGGRIKRITGEEGAKIVVTNGDRSTSRVFVIGTSNTSERFCTVRNLEIECITTNNSASISGFQRCLLVDGCKATFTGPTTNGNDNIFAGDCNGLNDCTIISSTGQTFAALINCININNFRITSVSRFRRLFENCACMNNVIISSLRNISETTTVNIFNQCYNITNIYCVYSNSSINTNFFNNCSNITNVNAATTTTGTMVLLNSCSRASNLLMTASSSVAAQALNSCNNISDSTFTLTGSASNANTLSNYLTNVITNYTNLATPTNGYNTCSYMTNCSIEFLGTTGTERRGYNGCSKINNCRMVNQTAIPVCIAFNGCSQIKNPSINQVSVENGVMFSNCNDISDVYVNQMPSNALTNLTLASGCTNISGVDGLLSANTITVFGSTCTNVDNVQLSINVTGTTDTVLKVVEGGERFNNVKFDIGGSVGNNNTSGNAMFSNISHLSNFTITLVGVYCYNLFSNSTEINSGAITSTTRDGTTFIGFLDCTRINDVVLQHYGTGYFTGFRNCTRTNLLRIEAPNVNQIAYGMVESNFGTNNYVTITQNGNYTTTGYINCSNLMNCTAELVADTTALTKGFNGGVRFTQCFSRVTNSGPISCFDACEMIINSSAYIVSTAGLGSLDNINVGKFGIRGGRFVCNNRISMAHQNVDDPAWIIGMHRVVGGVDGNSATKGVNVNNVTNYRLAYGCYGLKNNGWVSDGTNTPVNVYSNCYASKQDTLPLPVSSNGNAADVAQYGFNLGTVVSDL